MKRIVLSALVSGITASTAIAGGAKYQETVVPAPVYTPAPMVSGYDWTGGYVGAQFGFGTLNYRNFSSQSGGTAGLFAGYRFDMGAHVVGIEGEINPTTFGDYNIPTGDRLKRGAALHGTYGFKVTEDERTLLSVRAGPSVVQTSQGGSTDTAWGLTGGIDIDHMLTDTLMLRGGLRAGYTNNLGSGDLSTRSLGAGIGLGLRF